MTKDDFIDWREHTVTQEVFNMIDDRINFYKDQMASGSTLGDNTERETAKLVGHINGLKDILLIDHEDIDND